MNFNMHIRNLDLLLLKIGVLLLGFLVVPVTVVAAERASVETRISAAEESLLAIEEKLVSIKEKIDLETPNLKSLEEHRALQKNLNITEQRLTKTALAGR